MVTDRVVGVVNRSGRFVQTGALPPPPFLVARIVYGSRHTEPIHMGELSACRTCALSALLLDHGPNRKWTDADDLSGWIHIGRKATIQTSHRTNWRQRASRTDAAVV